MSRNRAWIGAAAALVLAGGVAWAGKPGGGGGGPVDTGTIYFTDWQGQIDYLGPTHVYSMNPDGSGKTVVPVPGPTTGLIYTDASHALHGGHRWFLARMRFDGEPTPSGWRFEVAALRDDGQVVRLTYTTGEWGPSGAARWSPDDSKVAYYLKAADAGGVSLSGVAIADVAYDAGGNVTGLVATPSTVAVPDTTYGVTTPNGSLSCDWSPDATRLVVLEVHGSTRTFRTVDLASGTSTALPVTAVASDPMWSPDGSTISYSANVGTGDPESVRMIDANGANDRVVFAATRTAAYQIARWSPNSLNVALTAFTLSHNTWSTDLCRAAPTGGAVANLTGDMGLYPQPIAWR